MTRVSVRDVSRYGDPTPTYRWIVERGVEHNDGKAQHVARVRVGEDVRIELAVPLGEAFHHAIDLLRLAGQSE